MKPFLRYLGLAAGALGGFMLLSAVGGAAAQQSHQELYFEKPQALAKSESALMRGDAEKAKELLLRALERGLGKSHSYTAHNNLCVAHFMLQEYEPAVEHCRQAIATRSNRWRAYNNLGNALAELGRFDDAIDAYNKALDMNKNNETIRDNLDLVQRRKRLESPRSQIHTPLSIG